MSADVPPLEPVEDRDLVDLACADCPATVNTFVGKGLAGPVRVVTVKHQRTCPWYARHGSDEPRGLTSGVLYHYLANDDDGPVSV